MLTRGDTIAADYVNSHGRKVSDVMTRHARRQRTRRGRGPHGVAPDQAASGDADDKVVGIVTRTNLLQAFATMQRLAAQEVKLDDRTIRAARVLRTIDDANLPRPYGLNVTVQDGKADLWAAVATYEEKNAVRIATEVAPRHWRNRQHPGAAADVVRQLEYFPEKWAPVFRRNAIKQRISFRIRSPSPPQCACGRSCRRDRR